MSELRGLHLSLVTLALAACAPVDETAAPVGESAEALTVPVLPNCSEANIRANAPPDADAMLDRAYNWIHRRVPYCQCVLSSSAPFRSDCSGFVSMVWRLGAPGHTTYSFAGGPWADHASIRLSSRNQLRVGDALNYPGNPSAGTGHIVLFGGWLNSAHTRFCSLEESHTGTPARVIERTVDPVYLPIRLASRRPGPLCTARCSGGALIDGDCDRHSCGSGRCVDDGHGARCVDPGCPSWGSDTVCLDARTVASCVNGDRRSTTRCTGDNPRCSRQGTGVRCESPTCPATGRRDVCLASGEIATCVDGRMGAGRRCAAGTFCSEAGAGDAACVARVCVADTTQVPMAHDACLAGGARLHCDARGAATTTPCPAGQSCSTVDGDRCVAIACPATGRVATCTPTNERVVCDRGVVVERVRCDGACVADDGTPARCVSTACAARGADGRLTPTPAHSVCQGDGTLGRCDDEGQFTAQPCAAGSRCVAAGGSASCVAPDGGAPGDASTDASVEDDAGEEPPIEDDAGTDPVVDPDAGAEPEGDTLVADDTGSGCSVGHRGGGARGGAALLALAALAAVRRQRKR